MTPLLPEAALSGPVERPARRTPIALVALLLAVSIGVVGGTRSASAAAPLAGSGTAATPVSPEVAALVQGARVCTPSLAGDTAPGVSGGFHAMTPVRALDTRVVLGTVSGGCTQPVDLSSVVPAEGSGAVLSIVAVGPVGDGFVTAFPCEAPRPFASNLNPRAGDVVSNLATVALLSSRRVCLYTNVTTDLVVDVTGWFGPGGDAFHGTAPQRLLDTRSGPRPDGGSAAVAAGETLRIPVAGTGVVPTGASGVAVNLTVTDTTWSGFITAYPCDAPRPVASNGNYVAGDTRANQAIVALDPSGDLCVYALTETHLVIDVSGWYSGREGDRFVPVAGRRVLDTRDGTGGHLGAVGPFETISFDPTVGGTVPVGAGASLDIIATNAEDQGWLAARPCSQPQQESSTLNFTKGSTATNLAVVPVGVDGLVCITTSAPADVVVDVSGSFGAAGGLRSLDVTGQTLRPAFSPDAHDYGIVCGAGTNAWTVVAHGVPGATVTVGGADGSGQLSVGEDDAVTITVDRQATPPETYVVRCLPHDFPDLDVSRPDDNSPGWYLLSPGFQAPAGQSPFAVILDEHGGVVWYQRAPAPVIDIKRLPSGDLGWTPLLGPTFGTNPTGATEVHRLDGSLVRTWSTVGTPTDHHDFEMLPNGNMMMISYHQRTGVNVSALGSGYASPTTVADAWIQEVRPNGTVAWSWHSEDHVGLTETTAQLDGLDITYAAASGPPGLDLIHLNSIDIDPVTGDVIASARHLDAVLRIRRHPGQSDDGKVLWKLGGNAPDESTATHLTIAGDPAGGPHRQHDARLLANGNITMFDNETNRTGLSSRAVEYSLDTSTNVATLVWSHGRDDGAVTFGLGSARRQPDGATVISWGPFAPAIEEVDTWGNSTFVVAQRPGGASYRAVKEPVSSFDREDLRAAAG